jgi:hypothetical protein
MQRKKFSRIPESSTLRAQTSKGGELRKRRYAKLNVLRVSSEPESRWGEKGERAVNLFFKFMS